MCEPLFPKGAGGERGVAPCLTPSMKGDNQITFFFFLEAVLVYNILEVLRHLNRDEGEGVDRGKRDSNALCESLFFFFGFCGG